MSDFLVACSAMHTPCLFFEAGSETATMCRRCRVVLFCLGRAVRRSRRIRRACYFPLAGLLPRAFLKLPSVFARQIKSTQATFKARILCAPGARLKRHIIVPATITRTTTRQTRIRQIIKHIGTTIRHNNHTPTRVPFRFKMVLCSWNGYYYEQRNRAHYRRLENPNGRASEELCCCSRRSVGRHSLGIFRNTTRSFSDTKPRRHTCQNERVHRQHSEH